MSYIKRFGENSNCDYNGVSFDAYLNGAQPTKNYGISANLVTRRGVTIVNTLIKFDISELSNLISDSDEIVSAKIVVHNIYSGGDTPTSSLYRCLKNWGEGNQNAGIATTGECSGFYAQYDTIPWSGNQADSSGNDFDSTASDSYSWNGSGDEWGDYDVTQDIKDFFDSVNNNYGWVHRNPTPGSGYTVFESSNNTTASNRPYLEIEIAGSSSSSSSTSTSSTSSSSSSLSSSSSSESSSESSSSSSESSSSSSRSSSSSSKSSSESSSSSSTSESSSSSSESSSSSSTSSSSTSSSSTSAIEVPAVRRFIASNRTYRFTASNRIYRFTTKRRVT